MLLSVLAVLSAAALPTASGKNVFAHYMVANSFSYTPSDWKIDINNAAATKIQGFALNTAGNNYEPGQIANAYSAAAGTNFSFFFSFDCAAHSWDVSSMASLVSTYAANPNTYKWNGAVLVSTYSGEANGDSFWASLKSTLSSQGIQISLAPAFIGYRAPGDASRLLSNFPSIDGFFNWWSWPQDNGNLLTTDTDLAYQSAIKSSRKGPFIMAVSPWQFKNLGSQNGNTNNDWVELSDTLWKYRWEQAIKNVVPDIVEIATWNDYAESHYISAINPSVSMDADAHAYVDGMVHTGWQIPAKHYISWYLNGGEPAVETDQVILWYRLHPKDAVCSSGTRPRNAQYPADAVFGLALLTAPATVIINIGSDQQFQWDAPAGASIGSVPFPSEDSQIPYIQIVRGGKVVADGYGSAYVTKSCTTYNFNPFVDVIPH